MIRTGPEETLLLRKTFRQTCPENKTPVPETRKPCRSRVFSRRSGKNELHTTSGLGQASHFASAFAGAGRKQLVDLFQFVAGGFGENAHHGGDTILFVVILQEIQNFLVGRGDFGDTFTVLDIINPLGSPIFKLQQEALTFHTGLNFSG